MPARQLWHQDMDGMTGDFRIANIKQFGNFVSRMPLH